MVGCPACHVSFPGCNLWKCHVTIPKKVASRIATGRLTSGIKTSCRKRNTFFTNLSSDKIDIFQMCFLNGGLESIRWWWRKQRKKTTGQAKKNYVYVIYIIIIMMMIIIIMILILILMIIVIIIYKNMFIYNYIIYHYIIHDYTHLKCQKDFSYLVGWFVSYHPCAFTSSTHMRWFFLGAALCLACLGSLWTLWIWKFQRDDVVGSLNIEVDETLPPFFEHWRIFGRRFSVDVWEELVLF